MFRQFFGRNNDLFLVIGVLSILLILFSPIPPALLDLLIIVNFAFALTILLLTFYVERPVEFSTFPSLLLVATLYRLALNIAATRLILSDADAGDVIGAIGSFAAQGNFVIGLVVFFILVVVQYVVVTSGAQRVSEVAARFMLDSVPGQQMSIDADLNMGLITQDEAKDRRKTLEKEASFYGAMDGASKFVKGDAIAGIIILLIDIFAGWIIGVAQMGLSWSEALETFTLLTIGDGIATQVPALIIAVATGIIVTRSSADKQLSDEVLNQLASVPKIPLIVIGAMSLLMLLPGMPKWPMLVLFGLALAIWYVSRRGKAARDRASDMVGEEDADALASGSITPIEILLGSAIGDAWQGMKAIVGERIAELRNQHAHDRGFDIPPVIMRDSDRIKPDQYQIELFATRYATATLHPAKTLAIRSQNSRTELAGIETQDPAFGLPAVWIDDDERGKALDSGHTLIDPVTALITHLGEVLKREAPQLLSRSIVVDVLEKVRTAQPGLVEEMIPNMMTISDVQQVLRNLLAENVSIRNMEQIAEALVDVGRQTKDPAELTELVRQKISPTICHGLRGDQEQLSVISLDPRLEADISAAIQRSDGTGAVVLDPKLAETLLRNLIPATEKMVGANLAPVLLCGADIRRQLQSFVRRTLPQLSVISVSEIPVSIDLKSFAVVRDDQAASKPAPLAG